MYEKVRSAGILKRDWRTFAVITACVLLLIITAMPIVFSVNYQQQYRLFQNSLADSTVYARENDSLTMECDGEIIYLEADGGYHTFLLRLVDIGSGRTGEAPQDPADVTISFGNGAILDLWKVELIGYVDPITEYGLFLRYTYPDGKIYAYDTDKLTMEKAVALLEGD